MQGEAFANIRCADLILYARQIDKCLGTPPSRPTLIASDSSSHAQVVNHLASANRSKELG